jgi:hypothetical protein
MAEFDLEGLAHQKAAFDYAASLDYSNFREEALALMGERVRRLANVSHYLTADLARTFSLNRPDQT